jgi:DNA-3-methyladenine glycosylase II
VVMLTSSVAYILLVMIDTARALQHFNKHDPTLHAIAFAAFASSSPPQVPVQAQPHTYAAHLYRSIISQQISTKAAASIYAKFLNTVSDINNAQHIAALPTEILRSVGLSYRKVLYVQSIAKYAAEHSSTLLTLHTLQDEHVIHELITIKGVGRWTAEMFLLFTLARPNVFSCGDLGLLHAVRNLHNNPKISATDLPAISKAWEPYCSTAALVLWHSLQNTTR